MATAWTSSIAVPQCPGKLQRVASRDLHDNSLMAVPGFDVPGFVAVKDFVLDG